MTKDRLHGYLKLSFAHHPVCWQYRNHTLGFLHIKFCLGCSGFYSGFFLGLFLVIINLFDNLSWSELVILSFLLYAPTMLRIIDFKFFSTSRKEIRFFLKFLLGIGIASGLLSILIAPDFLIQVIQIILGITLYAGLTIARIKDKDAFKECELCSFERSNNCPGFAPFFIQKSDIHLNFKE